MEKITGFGMRNSIAFSSLANKCFNSLRDVKDEPIYTSNDEYMQYLLRQSMKKRRCVAFSQY